jgi:hypothetical protein
MATGLSRREAVFTTAAAVTAVNLLGQSHRADAASPSDAIPRVILHRARAQSIPDEWVTKVLWDTEREDPLGWWNPASPGTITVTQSGFYIVTLQLCWADRTDDSDRAHHLELNGRIVLAFAFNPTRWNGTSSLTWMGTVQAPSRFELFVFQSSGSSLGFGGYNRPPGTAGISANCEICVARTGL